MNGKNIDPLVDSVIKLLRLGRKRRREIRSELEDHIAMQRQDLLDAGFTPDEATARILDEFGDAAELAHRFGLIGQRRRWIMRSAFAASIVAVFALAASFLSPVQTGNPFSPMWGGAAQTGPAARAGSGAPAVPVVGASIDDADTAAARALEATAPDVSMEATPLVEALDYVRELTGVNMIVWWDRLEGAGVARDRTITLKLTKLRAGAVLRMILELAGEADAALGYEIRDGIVQVSTMEHLARAVEVRLYSCTDLLRHPPSDWVVAELTRALGARGTAPGLRAGRELKFGEAEAEPDAVVDGVLDGVVRRRRLELVEVVQSTVAPDSWRDNGGAAGSVSVFDDVLVVVQTRKNHEAVAELLRHLAEARQKGTHAAQ